MYINFNLLHSKGLQPEDIYFLVGIKQVDKSVLDKLTGDTFNRFNELSLLTSIKGKKGDNPVYNTRLSANGKKLLEDIETPEVMAQLFEGYKTECKSNPRKKHVFVGKDGTSDYELLERPLTMEGFRVYCFQRIGCIKQYFDNADQRYNEYMPICHAIRDLIRLDQIEGGMVGQYNASITQRLNGLAEQSEITQKTEQPLFD